MQADDLPLLRRWLTAPHVAAWWPDECRQIEKLRGYLTDPGIDQFMVTANGRMIGYLQCYDPHTEPDHPYAAQPAGTRGIDQLIGEVEMVGRGHGSAFVRQFVDGVLAAGAHRVLTDPDPRNARAIRAYEKAGFRIDRLLDTPDGIALLMVRDA
jgi:aminoglycoside 6'-N-acetyltransferase